MKSKEKDKQMKVDFSSLDKSITAFVFTVRDKEIPQKTSKQQTETQKKKLNVELIKKLIQETKKSTMKQKSKNKKTPTNHRQHRKTI